MSNRHLFWAMAALAAAPLLAESTTQNYNFRYSTLDRAGELAVRPTSEATGLSFTLNDETFDKAIGLDAAGGPAGETVTEWRPVAFVPPTVTVTAISVAIPGTDAPAFITVTLKDGDQAKFTLADTAETVSLVGADGIAHTATLCTYKNATGVTLQPDQDYAFRFDDSQVGTAVRNFYTINGAPHLRLTGTADITRHVLSISDGVQHAFGTLLEEQTEGAENAADHIVIVAFSGEGGTLSMDSGLTLSPFVVSSSVPAEKAVVQASKVLSSPLSLRDGAEGPGGVTLSLPSLEDDHYFAPPAFLLACDLTLKSPIPVVESSWFAENPVTIPAGRTVRLELPGAVDSEDNLPDIAFADATSVLELASNAVDEDGTPQGIPPKYVALMTKQSGTLVLDRDVEAPSSAFVATVQNLDTTLILTGDHTFDFGTLFTADDWSEYGRPSNFRSFTLIQESGKSSFGSQFSLIRHGAQRYSRGRRHKHNRGHARFSRELHHRSRCRRRRHAHFGRTRRRYGDERWQWHAGFDCQGHAEPDGRCRYDPCVAADAARGGRHHPRHEQGGHQVCRWRHLHGGGLPCRLRRRHALRSADGRQRHGRRHADNRGRRDGLDALCL